MDVKATIHEIAGGHVAVWEGVKAGDVCLPVQYGGAADRSVQATGIFGGATVTIEGTLETVPTTYGTLTDPQGNGLVLSNSKIEAITEMVRHVRPTLAGGDGTTDLNIHILLRSR